MVITPGLTYQAPVQEPQRTQNAPLPQEVLRVVETLEKGQATSRDALRSNESEPRREVQERQHRESAHEQNPGLQAEDAAPTPAAGPYRPRSAAPLGTRLDVYA